MVAQLGDPLVWVFSALTLGLGAAHQSLKATSRQVGFCAETPSLPALLNGLVSPA